jgi:quercetin dioxygenase-like cupin family protein
MKNSNNLLVTSFLFVIFFISSSYLAINLAQDSTTTMPKPMVIKLNIDTADYQRILPGPPATVTMRSGLVVLEPDSTIGTHNTESYEEALIVFEGRGEMKITTGPVLKLEPGVVAYCPPNTEHNVINVGATKLKYIYIVAKTK